MEYRKQKEVSRSSSIKEFDTVREGPWSECAPYIRERGVFRVVQQDRNAVYSPQYIYGVLG